MIEKLKIAIEASLAAGKEIMKVYQNEDFQVEIKGDDSPLTIADKRANNIINNFLIHSGIPLISEENVQLSYEERKGWEECWIVDPLDGTKEFIKRNGEFTVNIALTANGQPRLGVIYAPALKLLYFAIAEEGKAYRIEVTSEETDVMEILARAEEIKPSKNKDHIKIIGSRSHMNEETLNFIKEFKTRGREVEMVSKGSSLKFCLLAEGTAHIYPRFAPTMEWDTAAGQAICEAVGLSCIFIETWERMTYNREDLKNGHFYVS